MCLAANRAQDEALGNVIGEGKATRDAQAALNRARDHFANTDREVQIFIPEWGPRQAVEANLVFVSEIWRLQPGQLSILSDEVSSLDIPLPMEKMADAVKHPEEPNTNEYPISQVERGNTYLKDALNGHAAEPAAFGCRAGDKLSFLTYTNEPVAVAVRILQRPPTPAEKDHLELQSSPTPQKPGP